MPATAGDNVKVAAAPDGVCPEGGAYAAVKVAAKATEATGLVVYTVYPIVSATVDCLPTRFTLILTGVTVLYLLIVESVAFTRGLPASGNLVSIG